MSAILNVHVLPTRMRTFSGLPSRLFRTVGEASSGLFNTVVEASPHALNVVLSQTVNASNAVRNFVRAHPRLTTALVVLALAVAAPLLAQAIVGLLGFGVTGVQAGSIAAWVQSTFYGAYVPAGSIFASLQSFGALALL